MGSAARSTSLPRPLADRVAAESVRRGVPESTIVGEAVAAYLDDEPTDESIMFLGVDLPPDGAPPPNTPEQADAIFRILEEPPRRASPALRKLLRGV
jgi:hypothetical protein